MNVDEQTWIGMTWTRAENYVAWLLYCYLKNFYAVISRFSCLGNGESGVYWGLIKAGINLFVEVEFGFFCHVLFCPI